MFFKADEAAALREKVQKPPCKAIYEQLLKRANEALAKWPEGKAKLGFDELIPKLLASKEGAFGKVFDRPFQHAFFAPKWFDHYTPTFAGMLEPGVTVPFGDGWKEVAFDGAKSGVKFVRVVLTKFWGIGGGLNEIQVYGR